MIKLLLLLVFLVTSAGATTFRPQPIEKQISEADGVFQGNFLKSQTVELENGRLATQMIFKMSKEYGLRSDFFGMDEVIVHYPGGSLNGNHVKVEGVPEFVPGEKVVLFIRNIDNRYWGLNLGFGSFKVINYGNEVVLVNYIFPQHPEVGQVNFQRFETLVKDIKGDSLKVVRTLEQPVPVESEIAQRSPASEGQNRSVASKSGPLENEDERPAMSIFWLIALLGFMGGLFRLTNQKVHK